MSQDETFAEHVIAVVPDRWVTLVVAGEGYRGWCPLTAAASGGETR